MMMRMSDVVWETLWLRVGLAFVFQYLVLSL